MEEKKVKIIETVSSTFVKITVSPINGISFSMLLFLVVYSLKLMCFYREDSIKQMSFQEIQIILLTQQLLQTCSQLSGSWKEEDISRGCLQ